MKTDLERLEYLNKTLNTNYTSLNEVNWYDISSYRYLSEDFIREFQNEVNWIPISIHQKLSESFIREFQDKINWYGISCCHPNFLSENFIREFNDKLNWNCISKNQKLSEDFIREFQDKVDWEYISIYQKLSETFIKEFKYKIHWDNISKYQKLSKDFIKEFQDKLGDVKEKSWLYKDKEFLKQQVIESGLYECHEDYFVAYKGIRSDRYSKYNFQYQYLPGETYESHCDYTDNKNSFGLSVWTEEKAKKYCNELIIKVKVNYEDVGRVVHDGGKIRVRKLTVLN